jgi:N-acyl-D-amino-acid deacylase
MRPSPPSDRGRPAAAALRAVPGRMLLVLLTTGLIAGAASQPAAGRARAAAQFDVLVRGGEILDGTGLPGFRGDVAIKDRRIVAVGRLPKARARLTIDARHLFVAPGFINIHSHPAADALPRSINMLTQGVTTQIMNPDGEGSTDIAGQLAKFSAQGLGTNLGAYIGFNSVWAAVMGEADHRPAPKQIEAMRALIERGLRQGAWGVSAGLDYKPAYFARTDEVIEVVSAARGWRTNFPNHERLTPESGFSSTAGIAETIEIANRAGLTPVITHIKAQGHEQGASPAILAMMAKAGAPADVYPYLAGQTGLADLLVPGWAQDGGRMAMLERFKDKATRARIAGEIEQVMEARFHGPKGVYILDSQRELTAVMAERHVGAGEAVIELLEQGSPSAILRFGAESDLVRFLKNPTSAIACDCGSSSETHVHPRFYGTFPRVLGHYVRDGKLLGWEEAVRKMTGLPASIIGLDDRGFIVPGMAADLTIFDPRAVNDRATYDKPTLLSQGIRYVLVGGTLALDQGRPTRARGGRVLLRGDHEPTRPMDVTGPKALAADGRLRLGRSAARIAFALRQGRATRRARGWLRLDDDAHALHLSALSFGFIQSAAGWASFSGIAAGATGPKAFVVTLDRTHPRASCEGAILTLKLGDSPPLEACAAHASMGQPIR